jgi:hypothetical protein
MSTKKISEWLEAIEDPELREAAMSHHREQYNTYAFAKNDVDNLASAVLFGFDWSKTPELNKWGEMFINLRDFHPHETIHKALSLTPSNPATNE